MRMNEEEIVKLCAIAITTSQPYSVLHWGTGVTWEQGQDLLKWYEDAMIMRRYVDSQRNTLEQDMLLLTTLAVHGGAPSMYRYLNVTVVQTWELYRYFSKSG